MSDTTLFYALAVPAVIMLGLSKGGFVGMGALSLPIMALAVSPVRAAAILLPVVALLLPMLLPAGSAQRLAFALWFLWALQTGRVVNRVLQP